MVQLWEAEEKFRVTLKHSSPSVILTEKATYLLQSLDCLCCYNRLSDKHIYTLEVKLPSSCGAESALVSAKQSKNITYLIVCIIIFEFEMHFTPSHFLSPHLTILFCLYAFYSLFLFLSCISSFFPSFILVRFVFSTFSPFSLDCFDFLSFSDVCMHLGWQSGRLAVWLYGWQCQSVCLLVRPPDK